MSQASRREYLKRICPREQKAAGQGKRQILDEFCANCGYHRKHAIRLLNGPAPGEKRRCQRRPRKVTYGGRGIGILQAIWEAADYPWSARLKALLPEWLPWIRRRFPLSAQLERQLLTISARSIDYRLRPHQGKLRRRLYGRTKPGILLKHHIPLKTDHGDVRVPGFTEIDLVSHSGNCATGEFCYSFKVTDIYSGWTETRAVLGRGQEGVRQALEEIRQALPFPLRGIDSDNGSKFINEHLWRYCQARDIQFTRGRPYKKDDNAHIEPKNWTHVRRIVGYLGYDTEVAREARNDLYREELRRFQNFFLPAVKLANKERVGARPRRRYEAPQTPWQRVMNSPQADPEQMAALRQERAALDPFELSRGIQEKLEAIFRLSTETRAPAPMPAAVKPERQRVARLTSTSPQVTPPTPRHCPRRRPRRAAQRRRKTVSRQAVEMSRRGKRGKLKNEFPSLPSALGNPATNAGFPHSHSPDDGRSVRRTASSRTNFG